MKYGHFSKDGREFIITTPNTPRPWINYLTNNDYCAIISQTAGGYSFYKDCRIHRINRWAPENFHFDRPGRYIYVKELVGGKTGPSNIWSMTHQPIRSKYDFFECRHGLGYTTIIEEVKKIRSEVTYFVPEKDSSEVWLAKITNKSSKTRTLELYPYTEWLIGDYHEELRYRNIMNLYNRVWFDKKAKCIFAKKTAVWKNMGIEEFPFTAFLASSLPVRGHVTRKDAFLGRYNTEENPSMLFGKFSNVSISSGEDSIGLLKHTLRLKPGESKTFTVTVGQAEEGARSRRLIAKYRDVRKAEQELLNVKKIWQKRICDIINVDTPDKDFNVMANVWMKYQLYICNLWSRSPSFYHEGSGGRGYRDSCQDAEAVVSLNPALTKNRILKLASLIRKDGTSAPGWDSSGPAPHRPNKDHQIWLTMTVSAYIKETGDSKILFKEIPYLKDKWIDGWHKDHRYKGSPRPDGKGTLAEHLEKNLNYCFYDIGQKGLPLIGHADWNDAIDAAGIKLKGESVWLAIALVRSLKTFAEMMIFTGRRKKAKEFVKKAAVMTKRVEVSWDGNWYARGYADDGSVYGSKKNKEGKIYINPQSWSILADIPNDSKRKKIIKAGDKYLDGKHGYALFHPAYDRYEKKLGRISMFSEGTKENAAIFCHAALFYIVALLTCGEGNKAFKALKKIMPNSQQDYELYKTEPYVFAEYLVGPGHPYLYGEGAFTWVTGTAGWSFMAATEYIMGAKRDYKGLLIDPCIPRSWKKCSVTRLFRGTFYHINIVNPDGVQKGVKEIRVDGKRIDGNLILPSRNKHCHVNVVMGKKR
ncbi:MAG: hypothetical protein HQ579_00215 [Candidatus Omnitrophica bacterium]|nr:hypothetical protein [Candidatus Omnitrophota bacterium]